MAQTRDDKFSLKNAPRPVYQTEAFRENVRKIQSRKTEEAAPAQGIPAASSQPVKKDLPIPMPGGIRVSPTYRQSGSVQSQVKKYVQLRSNVRDDIATNLEKQLPEGMKLSDVKGFDVNRYIEQQTDARVRVLLNPTPDKRHASRIQFQKENEAKAQIRTDVAREIVPTIPRNTSKEEAQAIIDKAAKEREDELFKPERPRYIFLSDGRPFYFDKYDERADLERSLIGESPLKRKWELLQFDIADKIGRGIQFIGEPSLRLKEALTDENEGNVLGSVTQLGLNAAMLGVEYFRAGAYKLFATEQKWKRLQQEAEAVKYTNPQQAENLLKDSEHWKMRWEQGKNVNARLKVAEQAVQRSWASLQEDWTYVNEQTASSYDPNARDEATGALLTPIEQAIRAEREKQEQAKTEAADVRTQAMTAYNEGNYVDSIRLIKEAQELDRDASEADYYGAYTWTREPEKYEKLKEEAALLELQKGEPLTEGEIRRLKEYHQNSWTEFTGEFIFDPLNLIPAALLDDALRLGGKALKGAAELPGINKAVRTIGTPIRWLQRASVQAGGNKVALKTHAIFEQISGAYLKSEDTVKAINDIGAAVVRAKNAPDEATAVLIFNRSKEQIVGLQNVTFREFKGLMDAGEHLDPSTWGKIYQDALGKAEDDLISVATQEGKDPSSLISEFSKTRRALDEVAAGFHAAYVDPHRIFKGSSFTDDTIAGGVFKTLRQLSGEEINETLKLNGLDEWASKLGQTIDPRTRQALGHVTKALESVMWVGSFLRDVWSTVVLTTPRFVMNNLPDTAMRSAVYGGNVWDDLTTLFTSTQRTFADELGVTPLSLTQSMARVGLDFSETVTSRLLYENWKPKAGLLSYWKYEYRRLFKGDTALAKRAVLDEMVSGLPKGILRDAMTWLGDGVMVKTPLLMKAWEGGIADFNSAVEFTFRLRMFHREYFGLLKKLEPEYMGRSLDLLSPSTRALGEQVWKAAEGSPRKIAAIVESITGDVKKGTPAQWSLIVPSEIERVTKGMDVTDRQLFVSSVRSTLEDFIEKSTRAGTDLKGDDFVKFFDDYTARYKDEIQERLSQANDYKNIDSTIRKDGKTNQPLDVDDLNGSAPVPKSEAPRNVEIAKATERIQKGVRRSTEDVVKDFEVALSEYATVTRVAGDRVTTKIVNGKPVIEIGEDAIKKGPTLMYKDLHEATFQVFRNADSDYVLRSGFKNLDEYEQAFRRFVEDPTRTLRESEQQFLTIANQLQGHPQLRELLERTRDRVKGKIDKIKFDNALDFYRDIGVYSDSYGFTKPPEQIFESMAQKLRKQPGYHVAAAQEAARSTAELARVEANLPQALADKVADFRERWGVYREELKQFYAFTYPGPLMKSVRDPDRHKGWTLFYEMSADEFVRETKIKQRLIEQLQANPADAEKIIDDALSDFGSYFLKENGITLEWDADAQKIMNIKMNTNGRIRNFTNDGDLAHLQRRLFTKDINKKLADAPFIRLRKDAKTKIHNQLRNALRDTFDLPTAHAEAWTKVIDNHAAKWSQETGRDVTEYYERLGFQRVEDGRGFATRENTRVVKKGAVERADGGFIFYGLSQSNFETMVRETGELFFDDLVSMAEHSDQAANDLKVLKDFIEKEVPGSPIRNNRLNKEQSDVLTTLFTDYVASGSGPDIKIKGGLEKFKSWLAGTFEAVKDTPIADEMNPDIFRVMDRLFIEQQIADVPKISKRKIKVIAKEFGVSFETDEDLLKIINEAISGGESDVFKSLDDVPQNVVVSAFGKAKESEIAETMQEGWETWRTRRSLAGFPDEALTDAETFKAYLKTRMNEEWSEASNYYNRLLWEVEQFENAILNHNVGDDFAEVLFPRVPETQISDGVRTFIRNQEGMMNNYESSIKALEVWKDYMVKLADEGQPATLLPKEALDELRTWSKQAAEDKAELVDTIINGREGFEGAIDKVNRVMIDYQHASLFDNFMKNFFPFWKFPSRSFPFWAETLATHPQLIANYEKLQRMSRSQRYHEGAITSRGKPMPSLDGYIKIPGTDLWYNPIAPLSFRYLLDVAMSKDDVLYAAQTSEENVEPKAFLVKEMMQAGQIYGFSMAPWMSWLMKEAYGIPDEILPRFPIAPQIPLIPRWMVADLISKANKATLPFDMDAGKITKDAANALYPEAPWHDYLVERHILEETLAQIQGGDMTDKQKLALASKITQAIKEKGNNPIWNQAYKDVTTKEWVGTMSSFFTGFHAKEFSDMQANMLLLRNERNQLRSALNSEFQSYIFDLPMDAEKGWQNYLQSLGTSEGWVYRLYTDIGWVRDEQGQLVRNPEERAKALAIKIKQDEDQQVYYEEMSKLQAWYNDTLRALPIGADWEQMKAIYDKYAEKRSSLDHLASYEKIYGTYKPKELIEKDIQNDWFRAVNGMRPKWEMEKGETYDQYQARVSEWETNLPRMAPILMRAFTRQENLVRTIGALHETQKLDKSFFANLTSMTTAEGIEGWEKETDDVFDALNKAYKATYWDAYWNSVVGKSGYDVDLSEHDFFTRNPEPPSPENLYNWIEKYYGPGRFTLKEIQEWAGEDVPSLSIEEKQLSKQANPDDYQKRQGIWNMLAWLGPGGRNRDAFDAAFANAGGDPDYLTAWYEEVGNAFTTQPEKLEKLYSDVETAVKSLGLKQPSRAELVQFIQAQNDNDTFKQLVEDEIGNRFFDYTDNSGVPQVGLLSFYGGLDSQNKKKFRKENGEQYDLIQSYYQMKEAFAEENPHWAAYYGFDATPSVNVPEEGLSLTPPNVQSPTFKGSGGGGRRRSSDASSPVAAYPTSNTQYRPYNDVPSFTLRDRTSVKFSPGLYNLVGNKMAWEVTNLLTSGRKISSAGVSFLRSVASRYPQYRKEITEILSKNG